MRIGKETAKGGSEQRHDRHPARADKREALQCQDTIGERRSLLRCAQ